MENNTVEKRQDIKSKILDLIINEYGDQEVTIAFVITLLEEIQKQILYTPINSKKHKSEKEY